jgi:hypothetical protein
MHLEDDGSVSWVALGLRCVSCGDLTGIADFVVRGSVDEVTAAL